MIKKLPAFANETEEANWWFEHQEERDAEFATASAEGRVKRGGIARRMQEAEKAKNVVLTLGDALKATILAEEKGVEVQAYLNEVMHEALKREMASVSE